MTDELVDQNLHTNVWSPLVLTLILTHMLETKHEIKHKSPSPPLPLHPHTVNLGMFSRLKLTCPAAIFKTSWYGFIWGWSHKHLMQSLSHPQFAWVSMRYVKGPMLGVALLVGPLEATAQYKETTA